MINDLKLCNFKAFCSEQKIPIKPITLIYGANSSGKSTILNAILMLKQTFEESISSDTLLLYKGRYTDQQNFSRCVNSRDLSKNFSIGIGSKNLFSWTEFEELSEETGEFISPKRDVQIIEEEFRTNKARLYIADTEKPQIKNTYCELNGKTVLKSIEYKINKEEFCELMWIGNDIYRDDGSNKLFDKKNKSILEVKNLSNKNENKYLADNYYNNSTKLKMKIDRDIDEGLVSNDVYSYTPFIYDLKKLNYNLINKIYEYLVEKDQSLRKIYTNNDFLDDLIYRLKKTIILAKNGIPCYYGHTDCFERDSSKLYKLREDTHINIFDFFSDSITDQFSAFYKIFSNLTYVGPLRKSPERFTDVAKDSYTSVGNNGERTSAILHERPDVLNLVNEVLCNLGLNYQLKIHQLAGDHLEALGDIYSLQILDNKGTSLTLCDVGFGLSQVLPILVQSVIPGRSAVLIEQPEIHLHPKMQTELGDFFIRQSKNRQFIIETHSEHLLLRILRRIRETSEKEIKDADVAITPEDISVLYVQEGENGSEVIELPVNEYGEFDRPWPNGFFAERARELF